MEERQFLALFLPRLLVFKHTWTEGNIVLHLKPAMDNRPPRSRRRALSTISAVVFAVFAAGFSVAASGMDMDYLRARWHPIHFKPAIDKATNDQCLSCHQEILSAKVRPQSPAGVKAVDALAWYQTLDTYKGGQQSFHVRHLTTPFAKKVMNLKCNFCHQGMDTREEAPNSSATGAKAGGFTLRKMVNPEKTCLMCHGSFPYKTMIGLEGPWHQVRGDLEDEETPNGCLTCHEELYRTVRHQVTYLNPKAIEEEGKKGSDACYGCHGGRQWYRVSYPYPRHPWPDMEDAVEETPEWAKNRPTKSDPRYQRTKK